MLSSLHIENYALIDSLDINLSGGLTIITGETGAGKSIILGALGLLMGAKADVKQLRNPSNRIVVEACFKGVEEEFLREILVSDGAEEEEVSEILEAVNSDSAIILRREVSPTGRSRAFINESGATLKRIGLIASRLLDIHSQRSNSLMESPDFRLAVLDAIAGDAELLSEYRRCFELYASLRKEIQKYKRSMEDARQLQELNDMKLERLRELKPRGGEQKELERRVEILSAAEQIRESLGNVCRLLDGDESSALNSLHEACSDLSRISPSVLDKDSSSEGPSLLDRLSSAEIEVRDIVETLHDRFAEIEANPALLKKSEERLEAIYAEEKRFGVDSDDELVKIKDTLEASITALADGEDIVKELEIKAKKAGKELKTVAGKLTEARQKAACKFSEALLFFARQLGMPNLTFKAEIQPSPRLSIDGPDTPVFLCAFNKNQLLRPLSEIASGGEMSRLMLCVKFIVAGRMQMPTVIFDEVDTGVSGDIADKMGRMMRAMASGLQVIAITHLPQVAVMGDIHFKVYKEDSSDATLTHIIALDNDEREREIARMLSGSVMDEAALLNARSLMNYKELDSGIDVSGFLEC